jgi:hypothetical protein
MAPDEALAAVAFQERELQLMQEAATPTLALLQRVADGDRSMPRRELRKARETVATLVRVQQQTARLRAAVRAMCPRRRLHNSAVMTRCVSRGRLDASSRAAAIADSGLISRRHPAPGAAVASEGTIALCATSSQARPIWSAASPSSC